MVIYWSNSLRNLNREIERLEGVREKVYKSPDYEQRNNFEKNFAKCKEELNKLKKALKPYEGLIKDKGEKEMAYNYYFKGESWNDSYELSSLFANVDIDKFTDEKDEESGKDDELKKLIKKEVEKYSKYIKRTLQDYYKTLE